MNTFITPVSSIDSLDFSNEPQKTPGTEKASFQNFLSQAVHELESTSDATDENNTALVLGDVDNIAQLQIDALKTQTLLQTTVQLTTRMVNAYKEIMQMQI